MAAWLPLIKATLPYVTQIFSAALPAFTSKSSAGKPDDVTAKQIAELQNAATNNAESIKGLAAQLKQTIEGIDAAGENLERELRGLRRLAVVAAAIAVLAGCIALWALVGKAGA
jgi:hypothetical protein